MRVIADEALATITIWMEAQGEPFEGKVAVAEVIRNRVTAEYDGDGTVAGTVAMRFQFSGWNDDLTDNELLIRSLKVDDADPIVQDCLKAWLTAQNGSNLAGGAVLYCNPAISAPRWAIPEKQVAAIGKHVFYSA